MRYITAVIFASLATVLVVFYAYPTYENLSKLKESETKLAAFVAQANTAQDKIQALEATYAKFPEGADEKMKIMLPESIDEIVLARDITVRADKFGLSVANPSIKKLAIEKGTTVQPYMVSFSIETSYKNFIDFLKDLELYLQLRDVTSLSFSVGETIASPMQIRIDFITYSLQ